MIFELSSYVFLGFIVILLILIEALILKLPTKITDQEISLIKNTKLDQSIILNQDAKLYKQNFFQLTENQKDFLIAFIYVASGLLFSLYIYYRSGSKEAIEYCLGFGIEFMLSIDNLFLIMLIFKSFNINSIKHKKLVLHVGLISAIIMRFAIIYTGIEALLEVTWMMPAFAILVIYLGAKLIHQKPDSNKNFKTNAIYLFFQRKFDIQENDQNFFVKINNKTKITTLFVTLVLIEITDLIFALDSIPAILLITQNIFIVYSANIFAVLGLRSFYNIIEIFLSKLEYINKIIGLVLIILGLKILI